MASARGKGTTAGLLAALCLVAALVARSSPDHDVDSPGPTGAAQAGRTTRRAEVTGAIAPPLGRSPLTVPVVAGVSPAGGPAVGGTTVTVTGRNFVAGETTVTFGASAPTPAAVVSPTMLTAIDPGGTGTVDVTVSTPSGTSNPTPADRYSYATSVAGWSVSLAASTAAAAVGETVVLTGTTNQSVAPPYRYVLVDQTTGAAVTGCTSGAACPVTVTQTVATSHTYVAEVAATAAGGPPVMATSLPVTVTWSGARVASSPVVVAAGDIACDPADPNFSGADPATCQMAATAAEIRSIQPNYLLPLGDDQYVDGAAPGVSPTLAQYRQGYGRTWGAVHVAGMAVRPVPGSHDYGDVNDDQPPGLHARGYFSYFFRALGTAVSPSHDWYSYNVAVPGGTWHLIALDSECSAIGGCGPGSPEEAWLRADLAAHPATCTLAYWHEPYYSSGYLDTTEGPARYQAFWADLFNAHAAIALAGSDHDYERFAPQDASGDATATGVTQFVVGTGGGSLAGGFHAILPNSSFQDASDFGVLKLTLQAHRAVFAFIDTAGEQRDAGVVDCPT